MITKEQSQQIWENVLANQRSLDGCGRHVFVDETPDRKIGKKWRCSSCGGTVDSTAKHYYEMGLKHGATGAST